MGEISLQTRVVKIGKINPQIGVVKGKKNQQRKNIRKRKVGKGNNHQVLSSRKNVKKNVNKRRGESIIHDLLNRKVEVEAVKGQRG